ncbi:hypothetical protein IJT93_07660 [bacterium]|nr:hypothetical protein [bacterium]
MKLPEYLECRRASAAPKLLRTYIVKKSVSLQAFKFEANLKNAVYRDWSAVQTNNSGAEKFLVYFAIVLSLMRYSRQAQYSESISSSKKYGALILDNPFGAVSSGHVLKPMFDMARYFKVQLICLSDITKSDVVTNFDKVIKAVVKNLPSSSMEKLALYAEGEAGLEELEHGYYQKELL